MTPADITLAHRLADAAAAAIRPYFRVEHGLESKADASPVTLADRAAEAAMRAIIEKEHPADGIIGEEYGSVREGAARVWVLDPIDGTTSFIAGRPIFGTLIALMQDGWPVLGVIDQPITKERWLGVVGKPTTYNGKPIKTRACADLSQALIATTSPHYFSEEKAARFLALLPHINAKRAIYGGDCYNYGLVASGHVDLVVESGLKLHDFAALVPIVEGAGGRMCDWRGEPLDADSNGDVIACGDPARVEEVVDILSGHSDHAH
jgi:histidinol phosphatase-like enzyme (inositol monophosphatase family)